MKDKCEELGVIKNPKFNDMTSRVYSPESLSPTIRTVSRGGGEIKIGTICLNPKVDGKQPSLGDRIYSIDGCMPAVATAPFCHLHYLKDKEYCLYFWETGVRLNTTTQNAKTVYFTNTGVAQADKKLYDHPTIKPLEIIKNLIEISSSGGVNT